MDMAAAGAAKGQVTRPHLLAVVALGLLGLVVTARSLAPRRLRGRLGQTVVWRVSLALPELHRQALVALVALALRGQGRLARLAEALCSAAAGVALVAAEQTPPHITLVVLAVRLSRRPWPRPLQPLLDHAPLLVSVVLAAAAVLQTQPLRPLVERVAFPAVVAVGVARDRAALSLATVVQGAVASSS